ncbi:hypothetical protein BT63DRAFT_452657 [Microthyrium microscopicum]|uniref:Uncharacterized protein n=1 Tax=Microthyrium microscopicum TaxID=703497 RepID=A0A6A6UIW8_9PEZI|nr:hypothetical protein BT63DRAFT_452657 [Microthyrium microscopicum]
MSLPSELVEMFERLSLKDSGKARVCRNKSETFFASRSLVLTQKSVESFIAVCNHPRYSKLVQKLTVLAHPGSYHFQDWQHMTETYSQWYDLTAPGNTNKLASASIAMCDAVGKLVNLKHIEILTSKDVYAGFEAYDPKYLSYGSHDHPLSLSEIDQPNQRQSVTMSLVIFGYLLDALGKNSQVEILSSNAHDLINLQKRGNLEWLQKVKIINYSRQQNTPRDAAALKSYFLPLLKAHLKLDLFHFQNFKSCCKNSTMIQGWLAPAWPRNLSVSMHLKTLQFSNCNIHCPVFESWLEFFSQTNDGGVAKITLQDVTLVDDAPNWLVWNCWSRLLRSWIYSPVLELRGTFRFTQSSLADEDARLMSKKDIMWSVTNCLAPGIQVITKDLSSVTMANQVLQY